MKNPFKKIGAFVGGIDDKVVGFVKAAVTEGVEHGEAEVLDLVAGVVEDFEVNKVAATIKQQLVKAIEGIDFEPVAGEIKTQLVAALNKRAAELRVRG